MKYITFILVTMSLLFSGCSEEWLSEDIEPQGKLLESNYYQTIEEIENGLISTYSMFKNQYWQGGWASWYILSSFPSDDANVHGGGRTDRPEMWAAWDFNVTPITDGLSQVWNRIYYGAYRANVVVNRVDPEGGPNNKAMIAEAKMLRAYFYFDLIKYFGSGPLITTVLTPAEYNQAKTDQIDIFNQIVTDLTEAAVDLPASWSGADAYRMTKYGALGLLGKVYTYMASPHYNHGTQYYDEAKTVLKRVIDESGYELEEVYDMIWHYSNEFNNETLIEMSYGYDSRNGFNAPLTGQELTSNVIQQLQGPRGINPVDTINAGWGFDMPTQDLVDEYRAQGDSTRLHGTAIAIWQLQEWGVTQWDENEIGNPGGFTGYYTKKRLTWSALNPNATPWGYHNNERILRLADIYLLYAEACAQTGEDQNAIDAVNVVRTRAAIGNSAAFSANIQDVMSAQGLSLLDAIKVERRLELGMEGQRFFDLVRWGDAYEVLTSKSRAYTEKNAHYPIPQSDIDNSGGLLIQNEGY